jgi:hypothetical protein
MLIPCRSCSRHVEASDPSCPFCGGAIDGVPIARPGTTERLSRAVLVLLGATSLAACDRVKENSSGTVVQPYGAPYIPDEAGAAATLYGAPPPTETAVAQPYGAPYIPVDAGRPPAPAPSDAGTAPRAVAPDAGPRKK